MTETITDIEFSLTLTRVFDAPRSLVYRMWSEPEHLAAWCYPKDFVVPEAAMDFRVGGENRATLRSPTGEDFRMLCVYKEIVPEERLVFSHIWLDDDGNPGHETLVIVTFDAADGGQKTELTFHQTRFVTESDRDSHAEGWGETLDNLQARLAALRSTS